MGSPIITKLIYHFYNSAHGGELNRYYRKVRDVNSRNQPFERAEISDYLNRWGFDPEIKKNALMSKADVNRWAKKSDSGKIKEWAYTGGSYGEPLRIPYSKSRAVIRTATFRYFNELGGYQIGDPYLLIRAKEKPSWLKFVRNETIFIPNDISERRLEVLSKTLREKKIKVLMGYPTVMYELALYLKRNPEKKNDLFVQSLISVSEPLEQVKRELIMEVFGCSFIDRYSNEEVGLIAQQREFGGDYYVNRYGVYVEIVDPVSLQPVEAGETGKVVVTDVCNDLLPVVRYDTGDFAIANKYENGQLLSMKQIVGRESEQIFTAEGNPVSPLMLGPHIYKPLAKEGIVYQFQFVQTAKGVYKLRIKADERELSEGVKKNILSGLKNVLGINSDISIVYVEDIKPQPSGKRPIYKNETEIRA